MSRLAHRGAGAWLGAALTLTSCSLVTNTEQVQCDTSEACASRGLPGACVDHVCVEAQGAGGQGGGGDVAWGCLGDVTWPAPEPGVMVTVRARFKMASASAPLPTDIIAYYCSGLDVGCTAPVAGPLTFAADGTVSVQVESGSRGYFDLSGPSIVPTRFYYPRPAQEQPQPTEDEGVVLITPSLYQALLNSTGLTADPMRGTLLTLTVNCAGVPATGVSISSPNADTGATTFYFVGLTPSVNATQTDTSGFAGIINMPTGSGTVETRVVDGDRGIAVSSFQIRQGTLTNVAMEPTPAQ